MKKSYPVELGKETWKQLQEIACFGYSSSVIFNDFVELVLAALLSFTDNMKHKDFLEQLAQNKLVGSYEERYMRLVAKYKENHTRKVGSRPIDFFTRAWGCLQAETYQSQQDVLGDLYESQISFGEHGQFFTPVSVTQVITKVLGLTDQESVVDPCCGSGRFFITTALAHPEKHFHFTGIDVSPICARMTVLNMWLFDLNADIYQGNTLTEEMSYLWSIRKGGFLWESKRDAQTPAQPPKALLQEDTARQKTRPARAQTKQLPTATTNKKPVQPSLFDLDEDKPR